MAATALCAPRPLKDLFGAPVTTARGFDPTGVCTSIEHDEMLARFFKLKAPPMLAEFEYLPARPQRPIECAPYDRRSFPEGDDFPVVYRTPKKYILRFCGLADFEMARDGSRVTCAPTPETPEATTAHLYFNQVLPLILSKSGKLAFHGSAVDIGGAAIGFLGAAGRGKSTLAAALAVDGAPFLADDGLALERKDNVYEVIPSHPSLGLRQDSRDALLPSDAAAAPVHDTAKQRYIVHAKLPHCNEPRPLAAIYFLGERQVDDVAVRRLKPASAFAGLMQHSFVLDVEDRAGAHAHFDRVMRLANEAVFFHLDYPRRYRRLSFVLRTVRATALDKAGNE